MLILGRPLTLCFAAAALLIFVGGGSASARRKLAPRGAGARVMAPPKGPMPTTGYLRRPLRRPPPLRIGSVGSARRLVPRPRRSAQLKGSDPARQRAWRAAVGVMGRRGGAARLARMAASGLGVRSAVAAEVLAARGAVTLLRRLAQHRDSRVRQGVARALGYRPRFGPALVGPLLRDRSLRVVRAAVRAAERLGDSRTVGALAALALRYDRSIRALALRVLARHAGRVALARSTLIRALGHSRVSVRVDAVVAVGLARAGWALYWLGRLARDRSMQVRRSVARGLGRLAPTRASRRLLRRLRRDRSPMVRRAARLALLRLLRASRAARRVRRVRRRR